MIATEDFPPALTAVAGVEFPYDDDDDIDYEPYEAFLTPEETTSWFRSWTGDPDLTGDDFRVFGQDGTGGNVAFWLVRIDRPLTDQPVVFFGSEGEIGVIAQNLADYLWLLADGSGPFEAVDNPTRGSRVNPELVRIAEQFAPDRSQSATAVIAAARHEFPDFERSITALCR